MLAAGSLQPGILQLSTYILGETLPTPSQMAEVTRSPAQLTILKASKGKLSFCSFPTRPGLQPWLYPCLDLVCPGGQSPGPSTLPLGPYHTRGLSSPEVSSTLCGPRQGLGLRQVANVQGAW